MKQTFSVDIDINHFEITNLRVPVGKFYFIFYCYVLFLFYILLCFVSVVDNFCYLGYKFLVINICS